MSGTKEQIKKIPKGADKILKSYGKGLKWNDMDKQSRDQITNSVPEILRDISSQKIDEGTSDTWSKIGMNARKTVIRQVWNAMSVDADYSQKFIEREVLTMSWQQIPHDVRRDIDNILRQNFSIELTLPQLDRGKLKKVAKTIGVPLATLLTNDKLMDIYPEILASKTATYLPHALSQIPALASKETITDDQANFTWDYLAKPSEKLSTLKDVGISDSSLIDLKWKKIPKGMRGKIMSIESFEQLIMKHKELPSYSKRYQALASLKKNFAKASGTSDGADKAWRTRRGANPALDEAEDIYDKMINADGIEETRKNIVELVRGSSIKTENQMAINRMVMDWDSIQHKIAKDKGCKIDDDGNYKTNVDWTMLQNKRAGKDPNQMENVCSSSAKTLKNYMTTNPALKQFGIKSEVVRGHYLGKGKSHNVAAHQTGTGIQDINDDNKNITKIHRFLYDNGYKKMIHGIGHEWLKLGDGTIIDGAYGQFLPRKVKNIYERIAIIPPNDPRQKWYNTTNGIPIDLDLPEEEYQKDWHLLGLEAVK